MRKPFERRVVGISERGKPGNLQRVYVLECGHTSAAPMAVRIYGLLGALGDLRDAPETEKCYICSQRPKGGHMRPYETMQIGKRIEHEGHVWQIDAKAFYRENGAGELRVYRVHGDVTTPKLHEALQLEADVIGLKLVEV